MMLFFRNIPAPTRPNELYDHVAQAVAEELNERLKQVVKAEVMVIRDKQTNMLEHHGLVSIDSDEAGIRVIKNLNGLQFNGSEVLVRCYKQRDVHNDRRLNSRPVPQDIIEKRGHDRRRGDSVEIYIDFSNVFYLIEG